jgi:hypothetical protein
MSTRWTAMVAVLKKESSPTQPPMPAGSPLRFKGKTPVLTAEEAGKLLRSIATDSVAGVRDRALIGVMAFTFERHERGRHLPPAAPVVVAAPREGWQIP